MTTLIANFQIRTSEALPVRPLMLFAGVLLFVLMGALSSCHTTQGLGRDIGEVGDEVHEAVHH